MIFYQTEGKAPGNRSVCHCEETRRDGATRQSSWIAAARVRGPREDGTN